MHDEHRQLQTQNPSDTSAIDTERHSMNPVRTIKFPARRPADRQSDPVLIGVALAEACAAITARSRKAARHPRPQTLCKARATG